MLANRFGLLSDTQDIPDKTSVSKMEAIIKAKSQLSTAGNNQLQTKKDESNLSQGK
jgi:hypothetical protein